MTATTHVRYIAANAKVDTPANLVCTRVAWPLCSASYHVLKSLNACGFYHNFEHITFEALRLR